MKKEILSVFCMMSLAGCASSPDNGGAVTAGDNAQQAAEGSAQSASGSEAAPSIDPQCKKTIVKMVTKQDGSQEYLLNDGSLWQMQSDNSAKMIVKLPDSIDNYSLIPSTDVIIHYTNDKIMLMHTVTGTEFFNLRGDAALRTAYFTPDNAEMGILDKDNTINIWNVPKRFSGINMSETVQDFINRQSPDYRLHFSVNAYNVSLSGNGRAVLASDDAANNKQGLIYFMDEENNKGVLSSIMRTNSHVEHLAISLSGRTIAATDSNNKLFVSSTGADKGLKIYARAYNQTKNVKFVGENVLVIEDARMILLDVMTGLPIWQNDISVKTCYAPSDEKIICMAGDVIEEINGKDGSRMRTIFFNDTAWGEVRSGKLGGTAEASCLK